MRPLLNTLYVTSAESYLHKDGENVVVRSGDQIRLRLPVHTLSSIVCFGPVTVSPFLLGLCAERGVGISFLSEHGHFLARVQGPVSGNVLLRRAQYRFADDPERRVSLAKAIVAAKIANSRNVLLRASRESGNPASDSLAAAARRLAFFLQQAAAAPSLDVLRGVEGEAAHSYFSVLNHLILSDEATFAFTQRSRRPPLDAVNALLSFCYTLLVHDCQGALESVGLDPAVGFLHADRPGRPGLALDLMEEFRPWLADRLVLTLINRKQIRPTDFRTLDNGAVLLNDDARKLVLKSWQERKQVELHHPFLDEDAPIGLIPFLQAMILARTLRGDLPSYVPFLPK
ncbi:MAG: type I-C CRISPR-associated endonuclease Cas1c [Halothiobacillaceae bacterium]